MPDPVDFSEEQGRQAFAALLRERIPNYGAHGALEDFAQRCGGRITSSQVGQYARGEFTPKIETLKRLCKAMGVPLLYGFSVLTGLESAETVPPPDDLYALNNHISQAADLMNRLMIRSTNAAHPERRQRRPRTNHESDEPTNGPSDGIDRPTNPKMDYDHQEVNHNRAYANRQQLNVAAA